MSPVFLFGTGRCGSTYIQRLISLRTNCWIWGEHDGVLTPLLNAVRNYEGSTALNRLVFNYGAATDEASLVQTMTKGAPELPWLSTLKAETFRIMMREMIDRLFREGIPRGWDSWGFKEIRYGCFNDSPKMLFDVFPNSRAVFILRRPRESIESMISAWAPQLLDPSAEPAKQDAFINLQIRRWKTLLSYFMELQSRYKSRLLISPMELILGHEVEMIEWLQLSLRTDERQGIQIAATNARSEKNRVAAARALPERYLKVFVEMDKLYEEALIVAQEQLPRVPKPSTERGRRGSKSAKLSHRPPSLD